jgi:hypothetical protein
MWRERIFEGAGITVRYCCHRPNDAFKSAPSRGMSDELANGVASQGMRDSVLEAWESRDNFLFGISCSNEVGCLIREAGSMLLQWYSRTICQRCGIYVGLAMFFAGQSRSQHRNGDAHRHGVGSAKHSGGRGFDWFNGHPMKAFLSAMN